MLACYDSQSSSVACVCVCVYGACWRAYRALHRRLESTRGHIRIDPVVETIATARPAEPIWTETFLDRHSHINLNVE